MIDPLPGTIRPQFGQPPVGVVMAFSGLLGTPNPNNASPPDTTPPNSDYITNDLEAWGWMLCDGRSLQTQLYPELFAALGYLYGGSEAEEAFNIPDYRGRFMRGTDLGANNDPDISIRTKPAGSGNYDNVGSIQTNALQDHEHTITKAKATGNAPPAEALSSVGKDSQTGKIYDSATDWVSDNETRPANIAVNYIIKFTYGLMPFPG